eukprot:UN26962
MVGRYSSKRDCPHPLPQSVYWGNQGGNWDPEYHREFASNEHKDTRYSIDFSPENAALWRKLAVFSAFIHARNWQYVLFRGYPRGQSWSRFPVYAGFCSVLWLSGFELIRQKSSLCTL